MNALPDSPLVVQPLQGRVEAIVRAAFPEAELHLETLATGTISGIVVTDRFLRMSDRTRVRITHRPLDVLHAQDRRCVGLLLALTHAEYASWLEDQRYW